MDELRDETSVYTADNNSVGNTSDPHQMLAYCSVCGEPTEKAFPADFVSRFPSFGCRTHHRKCACERARDEAEEKERLHRDHVQKVQHLLDRCFSGTPSMRNMTFAASTSDNPAVIKCRKYVTEQEAMSADNLGMILWGDVGTGKTYMAACIANALIEQEVSVLMINLGDVINATFEVREEIMTNVKQCAI